VVAWAIFSTVGAQAQLCSSKSAVFKVSSAQDAAKLTTAALCNNANITAVWKGKIQLAETIVVGNGTSLIVSGVFVEAAMIDGSNKIQLFDVWGQLTLVNVTLTNGFDQNSGGAI
jgi:hypothetical protein